MQYLVLSTLTACNSIGEMKKKNYLIGIMCFSIMLSDAITEKTETHKQCYIAQEREIIEEEFAVPTLLTRNKKTQCQVHGEDQKMLRCGQTAVYIKPECVCSFHNVYEAIYHGHSSCPEGAGSDIVTQLKCPDCKKYSLNNNGPCINGGKLTCKGEEVAPQVTCQCPPNYTGAFCEIKIENVTRICNRISQPSPSDLENCNVTWKECVTYNRNELYAYKCETNTLHDTRGLRLCLDTENRTEISTSETNQEGNRGRNFGSRHAMFYVYLVLVVALVLLLVFVCYNIYRDRKRAKLTENIQI